MNDYKQKKDYKQELIQLFKDNVKGKKANTEGRNEKHDGSAGNWLEEQFGKTPDANNSADFYGYELKNETTSNTTFGDWSPNRFIFKMGDYIEFFKDKEIGTPQDNFCKIFGKSNEDKNGRYSWSGEPVPKIGSFNSFGQKLMIEDSSNDIIVIYSYSEDQRCDKSTIVPEELQQENLELARWFGNISPTTKKIDKCLKQKLEDKFNVNGWFTCKKNSEGIYNKICFGKPINFKNWIELVKEKIVFFDSGMYQGNKRPYSQWRANNSFWNSLIEEEYE